VKGIEIVNWIRGFSEQSPGSSGVRNLEDAPPPMRQELVDLFFSLAEHNQEEIPPQHVYQVICQSLGIRPSGSPHSGYRHAAGRAVRDVEWPRIYDLVARLWPDFDKQGHGHRFREGANRILAAYGVAWEMGEDGRLNRVLPVAAQTQVTEVFAELLDPRFGPALELFKLGRNAFDDRPRRDRDACTNIFDALESVAKEKHAMPTATYGQVVARLRANSAFNPDILTLLAGLNDLRNHNFGHGMTVQFTLTSAEVDFAYLACVGAILLLTRTP
jgi:hypothetical protein